MPTSRADVAHLLRRTGFGGTAAQIDSLVSQDLSTIVDTILSLPGAPPDTKPALIGDTSKGFEEWAISWKYWWYNRMISTPAPLQEKLTLFWHNHFTSQVSKVRPDLMYDQNRLFRANCMGNFRTLTQAMAIQPAMLFYLDNRTNRAGVAQENFARELWELFMTGVDEYTQEEVAASARAWTGHTTTDWVTSFVPLTYQFNAAWHDNGNKTIFGATRNFNGPDVIDWTLDGPKKDTVARFICSKLWSFFAHPNPPASVVSALAAVFTANNWEIKPVLRAMFLRPEFYSDTAKQNLLKNPAEFIVYALKYSGVPTLNDALVVPVGGTRIHWYDENMGMQLGEPPDVSGWKQNNYWISMTQFLGRAEFVTWVARAAADLGLFSTFKTDPTLTPTQMADLAFAQFAVEPSAHSRQTLVAFCARHATAVTGRNELPYHVTRIVLLSPDFAMA
ncbi:MAG: DUF1800 family protein [Acidimicrobiia bacterium]